MGVPQLSYPRINGNRYSYASIEVNISGVPYRGVKSIDYENSVERAKQYGAGSRPLGRTRGKYDPTCSLEVYKEEASVIRAALAKVSGVGYGDATFNITVSYDEPGTGTVVDKIQGCVIEKDSDSHSQSADGLSEKWTLNVMEIVRNGISMLSQFAK